MVTITGRLIFDKERTFSLNTQNNGIGNVPIVLQNKLTNERLFVLTKKDGDYTFKNVPEGTYRIVEAYGYEGIPSLTGDFKEAEIGTVPKGANPPITFVNNAPIGATDLDSLTQDTLELTITDKDLTNLNFLDGPVKYSYLQEKFDNIGNNLITNAENGTFGTCQAGTRWNTCPAGLPYADLAPEFQYVVIDPTTHSPDGGQISIVNALMESYNFSIDTWWRITNQETKNEIGRMLIVNGDKPGAVFFKDTIKVEPHKYYLLRAWILNLIKKKGMADPKLGIRILNGDGQKIYEAELGAKIPVNENCPEWKEIGTIISSGTNTKLTLEFISQALEAWGNDYVIDNISLKEIKIDCIKPIKSCDKRIVHEGDIVTYKIEIENTLAKPIKEVKFKDVIPEGLEFIPGSVKINNSSKLSINPNEGFDLEDISSGAACIVEFKTNVIKIPTENPTWNKAIISYRYQMIEGEAKLFYEVETNEVPVCICSF